MSSPDAEHAPLPYGHIMTHRESNKTHGTGHSDNLRAHTNVFDINAFNNENVNHINHVANLPRISTNISPLLPFDNNKSIALRDTQFTSRFLYADSYVLNLWVRG